MVDTLSVKAFAAPPSKEVIFYGFLNALIAIPGFFLAIKFEKK
jgi:hypothetical protein